MTRNVEPRDLRLDYSVECENCGVVEDIPVGFSETKAQTALRDQGWRLIDDENRCPACAKNADGAIKKSIQGGNHEE